ncbi:zinc finger DHHC-type containing 8 [Dermatophagoides farinae]|uniref:zinc finger DHHC-type containing 8 n=1 Tax=Dermatophagoides farinae TaxID=6954 RepID=UPI003F61B7EE
MPKCKSIKRLIPATCAWILLLSTTALFFIFPCRRLHEEYHFSITIAQAIIAFFVISNLFATTFVDPGIIKRANPDEDKDDFRAPIYQEVQIKGHTVRMKWCSTCQFYRPPRCSHCSVCDNCIEKFDHHCPWVNNCIGRRNYRHFFFFLIFLTLHMITIFSWCLIFVINNRNIINETAVIVAIALIVIITLFFIPIVGLTGFHIILVARGRTTNEQVTRKFNRQINPFSNGIIFNCIFTVCGPRYPGLYKTKISKISSKGSDIRIYMDNKPDSNEKKIDDLNFSVVDNSKDILLERFDGHIGNNNKKRNESYQESSSTNQDQQQNRMHYNLTPGNDTLYDLNGLRAEESHVVTMHHTENGTKETTFIALSSNPMPLNHDSSNKSAGIFPHHHNNKISASKSTSINEISSHLMNKNSPLKNDNHYGKTNGPEGGMLIYYSPDAGYAVNSHNNHSNKFNSETELQNLSSSSKNGNFLQYIDEDSLDFGPNSSCSDTTTISKNYFKRPMPFQKALEISNKIEHQNKNATGRNVESSVNNNRQSQYEMNYEISV